MNVVTKDTTLCISLSGRPSNIGVRFHNFLYAELGLDFVYKACTTTDIAGAVAGIRALGIRGCGVSMPYKESCLALVDEVDDSASGIGAVNTIVNTDGHLCAYNTDVIAVRDLLASHQVDPATRVCVVGSGGMARAVLAGLRDHGFTDGVVCARNEEAGRALAQRYDLEWVSDAATVRADLVVNATPIGMTGPDADRLPVSANVIDAARVVFDVVAFPSETPMITAARERGRHVITGAEVIALQAAEQFALYTGVRPTDDQVARASEFSRAS